MKPEYGSMSTPVQIEATLRVFRRLLILSGNQLTGPIPQTLGQLDSLWILDLSDNQLTGPIPKTLGQLENLRSLYLSGNLLTGCIPSALQAIPDNDLDGLGLSSCHLVEDPQAAVLAALYEATSGDRWTDNTNWLSEIPLNEWYGVTTDDEGQVTALDLSSNGLRGSIPEALGQLNSLESLNLSRNGLMTGQIPETLGQLNNLKTLILSENSLTGQIPETLGQLNNLEILELFGNDLTGSIPETLGQLNNLKFLSLSFNRLTEDIPETLEQLNNLQSLYLSFNQLTGCIPSALQAIPNNDFNDLGLAFCQ